MAAIAFQTNANSTSYANTASGACALTADGDNRYYDDSLGLFAEGTQIYVDDTLSDKDTYRSDGTTPKDSLVQYFYTASVPGFPGIVFEVDVDGLVENVSYCPVTYTAFDINGTEFKNDPYAACFASTDGDVRYFEDNYGTLSKPGSGSTIYLDNAGVNPDEFEEDGVTPKDASTQYWYTTDLGESYLVGTNGVVITPSVCPIVSSFEINGAEYKSTDVDACANSTNGDLRYFVNNLIPGLTATEPAVGDIIFTDPVLTTPDIYLPDGTTVKTAGAAYWYTTEFGEAYLVQEQGRVAAKSVCGSTAGVDLGSGQGDSTLACNNNNFGFTFFAASGNTTATVVIGDVLYTDVGLTNPLVAPPGQDFFNLYQQDSWIQVDNTGEVIDKGPCGTSSFNIDLSMAGFPYQVCDDPIALFRFSAQENINIAVGSFIFMDSGLVTPYDGGGAWHKLDGTDKSIQINVNGEVLDIITCPIFPVYDVYKLMSVPTSSNSFEKICDGVATPETFWYVSNTGPKSMLGVAAAEEPIFQTEANAFVHAFELNSEIPNPPSYGTIWQKEFWFEVFPITSSINPFWVHWNGLDTSGANGAYSWENSGVPEECVYIMYETYGIDLAHDIDNDATTASDFCTSVLTTDTFYYSAPEGSSFGLFEIAQQNILIFNTQQGADSQLGTDIAAKQIYSEPAILSNLNWFYFGDDISTGGKLWFGFDDDFLLATGQDITESGSCDDYIRPVPVTPVGSPYDFESSDPFASSVYYSFWSCTPIPYTSGPAPVGAVTWNMYVVDGEHFAGDENYMTLFIEALIDEEKTTYSWGEDECVTYTHSVVATDIDEAVLILQTQGYTPTGPKKSITVQKDASAIGIYSGNTVSAVTDCTECGDAAADTYDYTFGDISTDPFDPTLGPNFNTEKNYNLDNVSRPLLRTNPKLTTNVKLIADSADKIYLESINASKDLSSIEYKKNEISPSGSYAYDLASFYNSKKTPYDIAYKTKRTNSDISVLQNYQSQIEEEYQYGAGMNFSKLYDEKFRIFAPIWADLNIPKMFVIFKVNNPGTSIDLSDKSGDNFTRIQLMLANSEIVKTFDLTNASSLGNYIRNHVQDESFPRAPLTFSFEKNEKSSYNGIDLIKGGFVSKAEYLFDDIVQKDKPLIETNDFITDGFRRNTLASANILNIEYMFDDPDASDYSVNRYFGLYVNDIDSGLGEVSTSDFGRIKFKSVNSYVDPNIPLTGIPSFKMMSNTPTLGYVSIEDEYYKISSNKFYDEESLNLKVEDKTDKISNELGIKYKGKSIETKVLEDLGYDYIKFKVKAKPVVNDSIAIANTKEEVYSFKFIKHVSNQSVTISNSNLTSFTFNTGTNVDDALLNFETAFANSTVADKFALTRNPVESSVGNKEIFITEKRAALGDINFVQTSSNGNLIKIDNVYTNVNLYDNTIFAADIGELTKGSFSGNKFSQDGKTTHIAIAMASLINTMPGLNAKSVGEYVYVSLNIPGYKILQHVLLINKLNNIDFIEAENSDAYGSVLMLDSVLVSNWNAHYFKGGNQKNKSVLVSSDTISEIDIDDYIATKYKNRFNNIIDVVEYVDDLGSGYHKIILDDANTLKSGNTRLFKENRLRIGLFSAYDIYDLNFDFYDTSNSDLKELYKEEYSNIEYQPYTLTKSIVEAAEAAGETYDGILPAEILSEDYELSPIEYFSNLLPILDNESIFGSAANVIDSEFDRLQENSNKEFSLNSRIVPNINKWILKDSDTVREQPYYLNANEAFGATNFSPDLSVSGRDRKGFTHEWFYMEKLPRFYRLNDVSDTFSYINFIQDFELTKEMFMDPTKDYFDKFMVSDGLEVSSISGDILSSGPEEAFNMNTFIKKPLKKKYTTVRNGNDISFASTIFKGIKVLFKSRKEFTNIAATEYAKNNEFNGYKFSTLVKVNQDKSATGKNFIEYDVIQNKAHKFVIFFITLNVSDFFLDGTLSRKQLYELNHKMIFDNTLGDSGEYAYGDVSLSGALDLINTPFSAAGPYVVNGINHSNGTGPQFETQISTGSDDLYGTIEITFFPNSTTNLPLTFKAKVSTINSNSEIVLAEAPYSAQTGDALPVAYLTESMQLNANYTYIGGGANAHSNILNQLSIQKVSEILKLAGPDVNYTTVESDGTLLDSRFVINFESGKEIIKRANLVIKEDQDRPKSFKLNSGTIGYNIEEGNTYYPFLIRHSGEYTIDMKPVVTFTDLYTHFKVNRDHVSNNAAERDIEEPIYKHPLGDVDAVSVARKYYNRYNRTGTSFNIGFINDDGTHDSNWGVIKNHFYHKVNDINTNGVIKLSASSESLPLYPLIGEIAIDKKDVNVFRSSWDADYYTRSLSGGDTINISGTNDVIEERSYLASTIMTLEPSYLLLDYTTENINNKEELDDILRNSNNTADIMIFEDINTIIADFYIDSVIYKKLRDSGVLGTLINFVEPGKSFGDKTTLVDDAQNYIIKNLLEVFTLDNLKLYTKSFKGKGSSFINSEDTNDLTSNGFVADNNFTYKQHKETPLNFRLIYNKRLGYSYDLKPMIKIKS